MYLTREKYIGANYEHNQVKGIIDITVRGKKIPIWKNKKWRDFKRWKMDT